MQCRGSGVGITLRVSTFDHAAVLHAIQWLLECLGLVVPLRRDARAPFWPESLSSSRISVKPKITTAVPWPRQTPRRRPTRTVVNAS